MIDYRLMVEKVFGLLLFLLLVADSISVVAAVLLLLVADSVSVVGAILLLVVPDTQWFRPNWKIIKFSLMDQQEQKSVHKLWKIVN